MHNIFKKSDLPQRGGELFETLLRHKNVTVETIRSNEVRRGQWYDQKSDEWVLLLQGRAQLEYESEVKQLEKGDAVFIPARTKHRVLSTDGDALWLALHIA